MTAYTSQSSAGASIAEKTPGKRVSDAVWASGVILMFLAAFATQIAVTHFGYIGYPSVAFEYAGIMTFATMLGVTLFRYFPQTNLGRSLPATLTEVVSAQSFVLSLLTLLVGSLFMFETVVTIL